MTAQRPVIHLHVGAMKTGTTYLQRKLSANSDQLAAQGVGFLRWSRQVRATQDLVGMDRKSSGGTPRFVGAWDDLVRDIRAAGQPVSLVSMEFLSFADRATAARAVASFEGYDVHVIVTVRDTAGVLPALWQTTVTSGGTMTWQTFARSARLSILGRGVVGQTLARSGVRSARRFRETVDVPRILRVWSSALPSDNLHVVLVPGPTAPRDELWIRFARVLGIDPATCPVNPRKVNESIGLPSADLVRRLNKRLALKGDLEQDTLKIDLAGTGLARRRRVERKATLDPATLRAALRWNAEIHRHITKHGYHVVGDLADLPVRPAPAVVDDLDLRQDPPTDAELLAAAKIGYRTLRRTVNERLEELPKRRRRPIRQQLQDQLVTPKAWAAQPEPLDAALADLSALTTAAITTKRMGRRHHRRKKRQAERRALG